MNWSVNTLILSQSLIHILVFHILTTLHTLDPHCHYGNTEREVTCIALSVYLLMLMHRYPLNWNQSYSH